MAGVSLVQGRAVAATQVVVAMEVLMGAWRVAKRVEAVKAAAVLTAA